MNFTTRAIMFAVPWTLAMMWWARPLDTAEIVIWTIAGAIAGVLFSWTMGWLTRQRA